MTSGRKSKQLRKLALKLAWNMNKGAKMDFRGMVQHLLGSARRIYQQLKKGKE